MDQPARLEQATFRSSFVLCPLSLRLCDGTRDSSFVLCDDSRASSFVFYFWPQSSSSSSSRQDRQTCWSSPRFFEVYLMKPKWPLSNFGNRTKLCKVTSNSKLIRSGKDVRSKLTFLIETSRAPVLLALILVPTAASSFWRTINVC